MTMVVQIANGIAGATERLALSDTAQLLPATILTSNGKKPKRINITVEDNACRIGLGGTTPTQGVSAIGHKIFKGDSIRFESPDAIQELLLINDVAAATSVIQITGEYS